MALFGGDIDVIVSSVPRVKLLALKERLMKIAWAFGALKLESSR